MSDIPFYLLAFIVVLGVLIVVHEFGHYVASRWCGVRVLRFSVGFGHALWQRRLGKDCSEWAIGIFPLGGFVKMLDEREGEVAPEERERAFNRQSVAKRSLIVAAGPAANFVLAIFLYWAVFMHGSDELLPILGTPAAASPAAIAGVVNGEQVRAVDKVRVIKNELIVLTNGFCPAGENISIMFHSYAATPKYIISQYKDRLDESDL